MEVYEISPLVHYRGIAWVRPRTLVLRAGRHARGVLTQINDVAVAWFASMRRKKTWRSERSRSNGSAWPRSWSMQYPHRSEARD